MLVSVSQPLSAAGAAGLEQSPRPGTQAALHSPPPQLALLVPTVEHFLSQAPQLAGSVLRLLSQPLSVLGAAGVAQLPKPVLQLDSHRPETQLRVTTFA